LIEKIIAYFFIFPAVVREDWKDYKKKKYDPATNHFGHSKDDTSGDASDGNKP
jgi:hypothetical protein